jgi:hypothetical protein
MPACHRFNKDGDGIESPSFQTMRPNQVAAREQPPRVFRFIFGFILHFLSARRPLPAAVGELFR